MFTGAAEKTQSLWHTKYIQQHKNIIYLNKNYEMCQRTQTERPMSTYYIYIITGISS